MTSGKWVIDATSKADGRVTQLVDVYLDEEHANE
jgi:hypothetical protein